MSSRPNTPTFGGYLLALGLGGLAFGLFCEVAGFDPGIWTPLAGLLLVFYVSLFTAGLPVLVLIALAAVVHLSLRGVADQRIHVAAAFGVPYLGMLPFALWSQGDSEVLLVLIALPISMALGRAAVVPLVERRRAVRS